MKTPLTRSAALLGLALLGLAGCETVDPYGRPGVWRPLGANELNFELQVARASDLTKGRGSVGADGETAAAAVDRLRRDKVKQLPQSGISQVGSAAAAPAGGS
jgi:type IV pilus biogenesis protein CpaD/CtpE